MEIITSIPVKIVEKIVDELFNATVRQFGYLCKYKDNIQVLSKELKRLADGRNDLQAEIDAAGKNGQIIKEKVQSWMAEVKDNSKAAEIFLEDELKANKRCLGGLCINLASRYKLSKEAKAKTLAISALIRVGVIFGKDVSLPTPPPSIISFSEGFSAFKSRELIMKQTIEALKKENISIIGICGMGGVGKTTIVKEIQKQANDLKMFDEVAMAVVSQTPSTTKIQDEIASWLGFKDLPGKDDPTRASSLRSRIQNAKRVLVILDDIWGRIELSDVGVPYGKDHKDCKILLTSRSQRVCHQMNAHQIFSVETLTEEESWSLFREVVGPEVDNPEINPTAREVADECGGLPIAILTVGRALKGMDQHVWKDANEQLKKSSPTIIEGMEEHVLSRVELSYNFLKSEEAKSIFLLCSCFPEDFEIPIEVLTRYGIGLMYFQNIDSIDKARGRAHSAVSTLIFSFLLIDGEEEGYVKMHDIVRYVAQKIASKNKLLIKAGVGLKDWPTRDTCKDLKVISLIDNNIDEVPDGLEMEYPNLLALLLQENIWSKVPNNLFQGMKNLNVLDLSYNQLPSLPPSFSLLSNLITLCLSHCIFHDDLSLIGELIRLEILDLSKSNIKEIPISFGELSHLKLLDLTGCSDLIIIPRGVISRLCKLEELYMSESYRCWKRNHAGLIELQALSRLTSLDIFIPGEVVLPPDMPSVNLTSFSIEIGYAIEDLMDQFFKIFQKRCSRALSLQPYWGISVIPVWIKNLLTTTEVLILYDFKGVEFVELVNEVFNELKFLYISRCEDMKYLFKSLEKMPRVTFHKLEWLSINSNPNFQEIYHGELPDGYFCKVKRLDVEYCGNMLIILPSHLLKSFQNLEYFGALFCESVVYVFEFEWSGIVEEEIELCSSFKELELRYLPRMTHIWKVDPQFVSLHNLQRVDLCGCDELGEALFPATLVQSLVHLEEVTVKHCRKLEEIFGRKAVDDHERVWRREHFQANPSLALGNLVSVTICHCPKLRNLFTICMVKSLERLQSLKVESCPILKEIITATDEKEEAASTKKITFPCLLEIQLHELDSLSCFCSGLYNIEFPALDDLRITECPSMNTFCYGQVQVTPNLRNLSLADGEEYCWSDDLNEAIQHIFNQKNQVEDLSEISVDVN